MERTLAFSTFLKLLELPTAQKATVLRGFRSRGGFNYWRPMQVLAPDVVSGQLDLKSIQEEVGKMSKGHQTKYNVNALTKILKWSSRRKISVRRRPGKVVRKFGNSGLQVRIEPEVAFSMVGHTYLMHVWATTNPSLSEETLSMGLYYFRSTFQKEGNDNYQYLIFDTVKDRVFADLSIFENAVEMLREQRETLSSLWAEIGAEETPQPPRRRRYPDQPADQPEL